MIVFPLDCWSCFLWWWFPLGPYPVQPWVATVLHVVLVPTLMSPCSFLSCWQFFMWCLFPFDELLFSLGLLALLHVVLIPSLMGCCSALCYWHCFMWCLFPLWPVLFSSIWFSEVFWRKWKIG